MKKFYPLVLAMLLLFVVALPFGHDRAESVEVSTATCTVVALGESPNLSVVCVDANGIAIPPSDIEVQSIAGDTVTVVVPEVREVVETVIKEVPGPVRRVVRTVTVVPDPIIRTDTVRVPGPTQTVTNRVSVPGPTVYRTRDVGIPGPTETVTLAPETTTATVTERPTRQGGTDGGTIGADRGFFDLDVDLDDDRLTAGEAGIGLLTLLALVGLLLIGMYGGYVLGYRESEQADTNFMRALRDQMLTRGNHS